jgi:AcrR family transcriptional regulator
MTQKADTAPTIGRPREFDRDAALQAAMLVFWRKGFLATSMNDLCDAMGIRSPSLYAAFGSKEKVYLEAIGLYSSIADSLIWTHINDGPTARESIHKVLLAAANVLPGFEGKPAGCMVSLATLGDEIPGSISQTVRQVRTDSLTVIRSGLECGVAAGELPKSTNIDRLSRFYLGVVQGMAVQAYDGATQEDLVSMADAAIAAWPVKH